jgi:type IV pilus assembly protein PilW
MLMHHAARPRRAQRGMSLVELMVGVTIGLFVVAAASLVVSTQLLENRRLITETQLQQDLRASADIITRELRRAGAWGNNNAKFGLWYSGTTQVQCNLYATVEPTDAADNVVTYRYWRSSNQNGPLGFKLENGVIRYSLTNADSPDNTSCAPVNSPSNWQDLTDSHTVTIDSFTITPTLNLPAVQISCPKLCSDNTQNCWPTIQVRELTVTIEGTSAIDSAVRRSVTSTVRLRNDHIQFNDATAPTRSCPV